MGELRGPDPSGGGSSPPTLIGSAAVAVLLRPASCARTRREYMGSMRQDRALSEGTRSSALWGRGSKSESRSSALWGRRGGRTATVVAVLALVLPVSGLAASAGSTSGKDQGSGSALVPQALLDQAKANPSQLFNVVVTGQKGRSSATIANDVNSGRSDGQGKLKRQFRSINGVSASLSGADLLKLADNSHVRSIVPDQKLGLLDYQNDEMWRTSTGVSSLWSHPATVCAVNALGVQIDPLCKAAAAFVAPQAPAIAIVDSGIDPNHAADFGSRILARADMVGDGKSGDPVGHGTMVAGVAAGANSSYPGVAQNAPLLDVRVADSSGQASTSTIIAGLDWILANKSQYNIRVVNMSLGSNSAASVAFNPLDQAVEKP